MAFGFLTRHSEFHCTNCGDPVRIPMSLRKLKALRNRIVRVACPSCGHEMGWGEERHVVPMRCAVLNKPFFVLFLKTAGDGKFRITGIERKVPGGGTVAEAAASADEVPLAEFDLTGFVCPHCKTAEKEGHTFIRCNTCHSYVCAGRVTAGDATTGGVAAFKCSDKCGSGGPISTRLGTLDTTGVSLAESLQARQAPASSKGWAGTNRHLPSSGMIRHH